MAILNREQILAAPDLVTEIVPVPEWGGEVVVRSLTAAERDQYEKEFISQHGTRIKFDLVNPRARLVALSVVDEDGKRLFTDRDVAELAKKSAAPVDRIYAVAQKLSGISDGDVEELEKNLERIPDADSRSD